MKYLSTTFQAILLVIVTALFGCVPHLTTERAAVVIFNDTPSVIQYQFILSNKLTSLAVIQSKEFDYGYEYEQAGKMDALPEELSQVILLVGGCKVVLESTVMENKFVIDPEGRNTWNLHVTDELVKQAGCK